MANTANVRIGEATLTWNGVDLGHTMGGGKVNYKPKNEDLMVDKYAGPIDAALVSEELTVEFSLAEPVVDTLRYAYFGSAYATGAGKKQLQLGTTTGVLASSKAAGLLIHPRSKGTDESEDIYLFKAAAIDEVELNYEIDKQRVFKVTFRAFVDPNSTQGTLGRIGPALS